MSEKIAVEGGTPVRPVMLPFHRPLIDETAEKSVVETLRSGWLTTGPKTKQFERDLSAYVGAAHSVAVNSCTAALHLALDAIGVAPGDEVITTPMTFAATANVVCHQGARPVFVDMEADTANVDTSLIEAAVTSRTRALVPVDFAGQPPDMDAIMAIGRRHQLPVIEDAAHSIGAEYHGKRIGAVADITAFSFYATKNITSGEGGAFVTNNASWAERAAIMSLHGISRDAWKRHSEPGYQHWDIIAPGFKYNMFDMQAALLQAQFLHIEEFWRRRQAITLRLRAGLADLPEIGMLVDRPDRVPAYHLFPIIVRIELLTVDRDTVMKALEAENIGVGIHYRAVHLHPYYRDTFGLKRGMFPNAEYYSDRTISLPFFPGMSDGDAQDVINAVRKVVARYRQ